MIFLLGITKLISTGGISRPEGEAIHDIIEHVARLDWSTGKVGMSYYCWSQWNAARTRTASRHNRRLRRGD
jgi:hypothetical protein